MKGNLTKFDIMYQRLEIDMKASNDPKDTQMYTIDFEISPRRKSVTIGHVYLLQDKFDTQGKLLFQDENQVLFKTIEDKIKEWIYG
jgi:hypothetical protein